MLITLAPNVKKNVVTIFQIVMDWRKNKMNIEDAAKVIYKMAKCDEEDCGNRICNECKYFTNGMEEKDAGKVLAEYFLEEKNARKALAEYFLKEKYINVGYDRTGDDEEEQVYSE